MVHLQMQCHSRVLRTEVSCQVLMPDPGETAAMATGADAAQPLVEDTGRPADRAMPPLLSGNAIPVIYLLHDLSGDGSSFLRHSALERHLEGYGVAAVLPSVGRSFGVDMIEGERFGTFLAEELPFLVASLFPVSRKSEDQHLAGVDAGGFAAFRLALSHPEQYASVASLSAPMDIRTLFSLPDPDILKDLQRTFGPEEQLEARGFLLDQLLEATARSTARPRFFQACGAEDFFLQDNRSFAQLAGRLNTGLRYWETAGGHGWDTWDAMLPAVLAWMFPDRRVNTDQD